MRLLVVSQYFYPESFRVNALCTELVNRGHEVTVLTGYPQYPQGVIYEGYGFGQPYEKIWNGVNICRIKMKPRGNNLFGLLGNSWSFVHEGKKWVKHCKEKFDAVYVFEVSPVTVGLPAIAYKKKYNVPVLFNVQDLWPENVESVLGVHNRAVIFVINKIVDYIYKYSDIILCSSKSFVNRIRQRGVPVEKLLFWPQFCVEPHLNNPSTLPEEFTPGYFNIVFTGNIGDAQGLDLLISAASIVKQRRRNVRWFLLGDGRAKSKLEAIVKANSLSDTVIFLGKVSEEMANLFVQHADCAYLSFKDNPVFDMTIPAKLQTYLACGAPILAAASGESASIIQEAACGIVSEKTPSALSDEVIRMMNLTDNEVKAMKIGSKEYYETHFRMAPLIDEFEKYIRNAIDKNEGAQRG